MRSVLAKLGYLRRVIVNDVTGHLVNGHLRVSIALSDDEASIPVDYVELTVEEEAAILATFDPIGLMAQTDPASLSALLDRVKAEQSNTDLLAGLDAIRSHFLGESPESIDHIAQAAMLEDLADTQIRLVYLQYPAELYPRIIAALDAKMVQYAVDSHAAALFRLVEESSRG